jgi:hypothetical protein
LILPKCEKWFWNAACACLYVCTCMHMYVCIYGYMDLNCASALTVGRILFIFLPESL